MQLSDYSGIFIYFGLMIFTGVAMVVVSHLFQITVKNEFYDWTRPYECGIRTEGLQPDRYPVHYYLVGILFVIFDVETIFIVPWAVAANYFRASSEWRVFWLAEMLVFLVILIVGYVYILQRGVLNWGQEEHKTKEVIDE